MLARVLIVLGVLAASWLPASAAGRIALVVGNDSYTDVPPLEKARNDARAVAASLEGLGFEVIVALDTTRSQLSAKLSEFEQRAKPGDTALFFFAGHGVALDGANYLVPIDVPKIDEGQKNRLKTETFLADDVAERLRERGVATTIMVLDACRNNPFQTPGGRSVGQSRGLARMDPRQGMFVIYSAGLGQEALDRLGPGDTNPNSIFTRSFVELVRRPSLSLIDVAKELQVEVAKLAGSVGRQQNPAYYDQVQGRIFLAATGEPAARPAPLPAPVAVRPPSPASAPALPAPKPPEPASAPPVAARPAPPPPLPDEYRVLPTVSEGVLNMRSGPGTNHALVTAIPAGARGVSVGACRWPTDGGSKPWCRAAWRGYTGWVSSCCLVSTVTGAFPR